MRCVIPGRSLKLFAKAIHCLSKIGDELYIEALADGLALRTVNLSRSAYACFKFHSSFFLNYEDGCKDMLDDSQAEDMLKCKIAMKSCLIVFKSVSSIDKNVDRCKIDLNVRQGRLVFLLYCRHGITKTHNLTFQECETLQAVFTKDLYPNFVTAQPKVLSEAVFNFPNNLEELTLSVTPDATVFKNYTEDEPDPNKVIHTKMNLSPEEFDNYQIGVDTDITFCLKELRAILAFGDVSGQPLNIHFETGGKPIVFSMDTNSTYEADFVLASLMDEPQSSQASQSASAKSSSQKSKEQNGKLKSATGKSKQSHGCKTKNKEPKPSQQSATKQQSIQDDWTVDDDIMAECVETSIRNYEKSEIKPVKNVQEEHVLHTQQKAKKLSMIPESSQENITQKSLNTSVNPLQTPCSSVTDVSFLNKIDVPSLGSETPGSQQFNRSVIKTNASHKYQDTDDSDVEMDGDDGIVPGTPPSKKFKSMFFGAYPPVQYAVATKGKILAENTDDEESD